MQHRPWCSAGECPLAVEVAQRRWHMVMQRERQLAQKGAREREGVDLAFFFFFNNSF